MVPRVHSVAVGRTCCHLQRSIVSENSATLPCMQEDSGSGEPVLIWEILSLSRAQMCQY